MSGPGPRMMVVDRIERHDIFNALMLAIVLLLLGFGIISAVRSLSGTLDEGIVTAEKEPTLESEPAPANATVTTEVEEETTTTTALVTARPPDQVQVRVANGARRVGVASAGTAVLADAGYDMLDPKNGPTLDDSIVYYISGFAADAVLVAETLGLDPSDIEPMPSDPGVELADAKVIVILGVNSEY
ncbi:MAG: LytR C-terminal domain-containing protein [Actinomycetota bacterium]